MNKSVLVSYFALLREERGLGSEHFCSQSNTLAELYDELQSMHGFSLSRGNLRVAKNEEFCEWDSSFEVGDRVVFIPPVAGG